MNGRILKLGITGGQSAPAEGRYALSDVSGSVFF